MPRNTFGVILFLLCGLAARPSIASGQPYTFVYVPAEPDPAVCDLYPTEINNSQQVVGRVVTFDEGPPHCRGAFLWDSTTGLRLLNVGKGVGLDPLFDYLGIDDAGIVYGSGESGPFRLVNGTASALPMPPGATAVGIRKVTNNGIILMDAVEVDGRRTSWVLNQATYTDVGGLTGAKILTINEQGAVGGCRLLDPLRGTGRPYVRWADGREIEPWQTSCVLGFSNLLLYNSPYGAGVEVLGAAGHFAGSGFTGVIGNLTPPSVDVSSYYGTADGRLWTAGTYRYAPYRFVDMSSTGTLLTGSFTFREGTLTDLYQAILNWPTFPFPCGFSPKAINDAGYIAATTCGGMLLLVPTAPVPPSQLSFTVRDRVVALSWQGSAGASEYLVEAGSVPGLADLYLASVGAQLSLTTPAPPGRYYVRVRARSAGGVSAPSNEVVIAVP